MVAGNSYDVQIVMQVAHRLIMKKFMGRVSHDLSSLKSLTPIEWVGPTRYQAVTLYMSVQLDTLDYTIFLHAIAKSFYDAVWSNSQGTVCISLLKHGSFRLGGFDKLKRLSTDILLPLGLLSFPFFSRF